MALKSNVHVRGGDVSAGPLSYRFYIFTAESVFIIVHFGHVPEVVPY